jgi:quercetin dioxygenase-like cupin family protein
MMSTSKHVIDNRTLARAALPGIEHETLAGGDDGLTSLSMWRQTIAPGSATPPHQHDCDEVILVQAGQGELHIGGRVIPFAADFTLALPRNEPHQIINTGDEPIQLVAALAMTPVRVTFPDGKPLELPWRS